MNMEAMSLPVTLLVFAASAFIVTIAGARLAREGDVIAARTRLGGLWFGAVFLALATSLPELMTSVSAALIGATEIAAGNLFGSSMANMLILALLALLPAGAGIFGRAALDQVMGASLAIVLSCLAGAFVLARPPLAIGSMGVGSLVLLVVYLAGTRLLYRHSSLARESVAIAETTMTSDAWAGAAHGEASTAMQPEAGRSLSRAILGFIIAAAVITAAAPLFAGSAQRIAVITGISETLVGTSLVGLATSLPEFVTSFAAVRIGAFDLAVGNLFGSNSVNMVMFVPLDLVHTSGPVLGSIVPSHAISALMATALMGMSLLALIYRARRSVAMLEPTGVAMIVVYVGGMLLVAVAG